MIATPAAVKGRAVLLGVAVLAGVIAAVIGALALADALEVTGLSDPGPVTTNGLAFVRAAGEIAAMVAIGNFLFAAFLVPPQASGVLDAGGYRAMRLGSAACAVWAVCAALLVALTVSDVSGVPLTELTPLDIWSAAGLIEITAAWRTTSILAAIVAVASFTVLRWSWTPALLAGGLVTLVPLAVTGHSSSGGSHDIATSSLLIHLVAAALWAGGLLALLVHALRGGSHTDIAARRFSTVALWCFVAVAASGAINAVIRIAPSDIVDTAYGLLIMGKVAALAGLGWAGWHQRRSAIRALQSNPSSRRPLLRLALAEAAMFGVAVGVAVGLGRTPPPPATSEPSPAEAVLGFDLVEPPTLVGLLLDWRFDLLFGSAAIVFAAIYLVGVYRLARRGDVWPKWRAAFWLFGCAALLIATSSRVGKYMMAMFSMHMMAQLVLSVLVPALLVQGAPVTLALKALRTAGRDAPPGPREWLLSALSSPLARFLTHPCTALVVFVAGIWGLHFEAVFDLAVSDHTAHTVTNAYFLISGALFFKVVAGIDPPPWPLTRLRRVALALIGLSQFVLVGLVVVGRQGVLGELFYRSLKLNWHTDLLTDQRLGGVIVASGGAVAVVAVFAVLTVQRYRRPANGAPRNRDA